MGCFLTRLAGYCGNSLNPGSVAAALSDCNMVCAGDQYEYCGAGNRLELYSATSASTATASSSGGETATS